MSSEELPILPPALESIEPSSSQKVVLVTNTTNTTNPPNNTTTPPCNSSPTSNSHTNAVQNVMRELADSKEHIAPTVLPSSHNFGGRPCLNMKEFFKLMSEGDKKQQNLDALYSLVEHDSDSIIGFVELNGLSFIDEWLDTARKENDYWFSLCILQFLAHNNLYITYQALQTAPIAKAVKQFINPSNNKSILSPQSLPRLTDQIRNILPNNLNISRANDNFTNIINRQVIHKIVYKHKHIPTIRYLQSQFASRIVNKWKKFVADWKKHNNRPLYRCIRYADEKGKPLISTSVFHLNDMPINISQQRDKKRREKMMTSIKWYAPNKLQLFPLFETDNGQYSIERGKDSTEKKIQKERIMTELEEFAIGTDNLKNPKELISNKIPTNNNIKPTIIPLESEQTSPSPDKNTILKTTQPQPHTHPHPPVAHHPMQPGPYPPPPGPYRYPPNLPPPHGHYPMPPPPTGPYPPQYGHMPHHPPPHGYPYPYVPPPPPPHGYPYQPQPPPHPQVPVPVQVQPPMQTQPQQNGNGIDGKNRRRDFDSNDRPSKRQKIHDSRDYYERDNRRNHRKGRHKHGRKHDRKHKNRRGRNGRRNNKNGI